MEDYVEKYHSDHWSAHVASTHQANINSCFVAWNGRHPDMQLESYIIKQKILIFYIINLKTLMYRWEASIVDC